MTTELTNPKIYDPPDRGAENVPSSCRKVGEDACCGAWVGDTIPDPTRCPSCGGSMGAGLSRRVTEGSHDE